MNGYVGKICPYCKAEIKEGDDVVICSSCEMPHHKDCWIENQGCTTFGCTGTMKSPSDSTAASNGQVYYEGNQSGIGVRAGIVYCTRCGFPNDNTNSFCCECGNRLTTVQSNNTYSQSYSNHGYQGYQTYQNIALDSTVTRLIGEKTEFYVPKFQEMKAQNKQTSWNWPAFLVSPWWLIYRKMYGYGAGVLAIMLVLNMINIPLISFITLGGYIAIGIFANYIYMQYLEKIAQQANAMNEPYKTQFIEKNAGVNTMAAAISVAAYTVLLVILIS